MTRMIRLTKINGMVTVTGASRGTRMSGIVCITGALSAKEVNEAFCAKPKTREEIN